MIANKGASKPAGASTAKKRRDPAPRPLDGNLPFGTLVNREPGRHYVSVGQADEIQGVEYYKHMGYEPEYHEEGGVRFAGMRSVEIGAPITMRGHLLMSLHEDDYARLQRYGHDGTSGSEYADMLERRMSSMEQQKAHAHRFMPEDVGTVQVMQDEHNFGSLG